MRHRMVTPQKCTEPNVHLIWFGEYVIHAMSDDYVVELYQDSATRQVYQRRLRLGKVEWWTVPLEELHP